MAFTIYRSHTMGLTVQLVLNKLQWTESQTVCLVDDNKRLKPWRNNNILCHTFLKARSHGASLVVCDVAIAVTLMED